MLTDPVRTWLGSGALDLWLSLEAGMWPDVADDLTRYSRSVLEQTERYPVPKVAECDPPARAAASGRGAALFAEVDVLLTPTPRCPRSRPRDRRPT